MKDLEISVDAHILSQIFNQCDYAVLRKKCVFQFPGTKLPETECSATGDFLPVCPGKITLIIINLSFFTI